MSRVFRPRLLLVDNHDSFTWNLAHGFEVLGARVAVVQSDAISTAHALTGSFDGIVLAPGPGRPEQAGISVELVRAVAGRLPLLGVCLGHQAIAVAFGGRIVRADRPMHGKTSRVTHDRRGVFRGLRQPLTAMRYHSLAVDPKHLDAAITVTAHADDGTPMGLRHATLAIEGVQFHPESVGTPDGPRLLGNFVDAVRRFKADLGIPGDGGARLFLRQGK